MRLPPQSIEAEESIIASVLISDEHFKDCECLEPEDFYKTNHQIVFKIMKVLNFKKERINIVTVGEVLIKNQNQDIAKHTLTLMNNAPIAVNLKSHAKIIKEASMKRAMLFSLSKINEKIYTENFTSILDFAQSEMLNHKLSNGQSKIYNIKDLIYDHLDRIEKNNTQESKTLIKLGFETLDKWIDLQEESYIIIAGRPSMGKTSFALTIIKNMAMQGGKPGIISLEMGKNRLLNRWLSMITGINTMNFNKYHGLKNDDWQNLSDAASTIHELWDVLISDGPANSIEELERQARQMKEDGATALFIDQLSHIGGKSDDDVKNFTKHSKRITQLKTELKIPIFLLAQLNRKVEERPDKEPKLSDLKMSGSLEEDPDIVILLYRPEYYEKSIHDKKAVERDAVVNIAKNRDGVVYKERDVIVFDKGRTLFEEDFSRIRKYS